MRRSCTGILGVALLTAAAVGAPCAEVIDRVVAILEGEVITLSDLRTAARFGLVTVGQSGDEVADTLEPWIRRQLGLREVNRYAAPEPDEALLARRIDATRARFGSPAELAAALAATGTTESRLRTLVRDTLRIEQYVDQRVAAAPPPGDEEVAEYAAQHEAELTTAGRRLSHEELLDLARRRLVGERRRSLMDDWLDRIRRRADVSIVHGAVP